MINQVGSIFNQVAFIFSRIDDIFNWITLNLIASVFNHVQSLFLLSWFIIIIASVVFTSSTTSAQAKNIATTNPFYHKLSYNDVFHYASAMRFQETTPINNANNITNPKQKHNSSNTTTTNITNQQQQTTTALTTTTKKA